MRAHNVRSKNKQATLRCITTMTYTLHIFNSIQFGTQSWHNMDRLIILNIGAFVGCLFDLHTQHTSTYPYTDAKKKREREENECRIFKPFAQSAPCAMAYFLKQHSINTHTHYRAYMPFHFHWIPSKHTHIIFKMHVLTPSANQAKKKTRGK